MFQVKNLLKIIFPERDIYRLKFSFWQEAGLFLVLFCVFSIAGSFFPATGFTGFDWVVFFGQDRVPPFYPPWTYYIIRPLTWEVLIGLTLAAFSLASLKRMQNPFSLVISFFNLPLLWILFLGQLDGLLLLGLLYLPWLTPLVLMKPMITIFAFAARKSYLIGMGIFLIITFVIWGAWFIPMFNYNSYHPEGRAENIIGLGIWGIPLALVTAWLSRGDMDMLMTAGAFMSPYLVHYHFLPITPAIARLKARDAFIATVFSWFPFSANWIGPVGWYFSWLFVGWVWVCLALQRYPVSSVKKKFVAAAAWVKSLV